ncbi:hypothetical protein BAUCODRAFT_67698 [Baudoinia panamericana UAMH 10762]|uniref:SPRY domain-containing protein n=1 Tax=Baudoinia panamericana (strain UAMH 10762) TaxID=717646 RepID=M2MMJ9_BAUPA|nr:uncharacterized protein BAUCODRAFT_67698 [Baudoinia panamericana UAMH 10762]EMC97921.1 hypothetical protein BAUCODRAFT_67698 [Baudoinia panamericana UAMH 10762]
MRPFSPAAAHPIPLDHHAPAVASPLNPSSTRAPSHTTPAPTMHREPREKKDSLKKRESSNPHTTASTALGKRKANATHAYPSPQRFNVPPPKSTDFEPPKEDIMVAHEPTPLTMPDGNRQLYKPIDLAENKRGYRYSRAIADPLFPHKQYYRSTSPPPHYARLSFEDADKWMHFTTNALITTNEKGWRMVRSNVCAREGTLYYEIKIHRGVPPSGPADTTSSDAANCGPQPHVRFGWARREAPLDAPVGFDGYSYGITDLRFEPMHRSRPSKFYHPTPKNKKTKGSKPLSGAGTAPPPIQLAPEDAHVKEGDIIGLELQLPSLTLHRKIVSGVYNPAVDIGDGFDQPTHTLEPGAESMDVIRDRIPVAYKGNSYFETLDHVSSKPMEDPASLLKTAPNPNHEHPSLRTLPHSAMRVYKNGKLVGTAFENVLAFLPPASVPSKTMGAREGFDDGVVGYFPAVSCFWGGIAEVNMGDGVGGFWAPPPHLAVSRSRDAARDGQLATNGWNPGRLCRAVGERYKEQIAEDVVWDVIDEVDFFIQDGGYEGTVGSGADNGGGSNGVVSTRTGAGRVKEEEM